MLISVAVQFAVNPVAELMTKKRTSPYVPPLEILIATRAGLKMPHVGFVKDISVYFGESAVLTRDPTRIGDTERLLPWRCWRRAQKQKPLV